MHEVPPAICSLRFLLCKILSSLPVLQIVVAGPGFPSHSSAVLRGGLAAGPAEFRWNLR